MSPRRSASQPGIPGAGERAVLPAGLHPLQIGLYVGPGTADRPQPDSRGQVRLHGRGDYNNVAPRVGARVAAAVRAARGDSRRLGHVLRAHRRQLQARPAAVGAVLRSAERAGAAGHGGSVSAAQHQSVPDSAQRAASARDANGAPRWLRADGTPFPATEPFSAKSNVFIDPLLRTPYLQQWTTSLQYELRRGMLVDVGYVGSRGVGLLGKVNLAVPVDPRVTPVNGFTDIYDRLGRVINPDFFVPAEFLGLNRNGGFQQLTNVGRSTYHSLQTKLRARFGRAADRRTSPTRSSRSMDTLSSDGGLVEHDPTRPENNFGPSDYDRTHRLTTSFISKCRASARDGSVLARVTRRLERVRHLHLSVGHAVLGDRQPDAQRLLRAGRPAARQLRAGHDRRRRGASRAACRTGWTTTSTWRRSPTRWISGATPAATSCAGRRRCSSI